MSSSPAPGSNRPVRGKAEPEPRPSVLKDGSLEAVAEFITEGKGTHLRRDKAKDYAVLSSTGQECGEGIARFHRDSCGAKRVWCLSTPRPIVDLHYCVQQVANKMPNPNVCFSVSFSLL